MELAEMKVEKDKSQITELGKFPKEWCFVSLENCCSKITDGTHDTPQKVSHGIPYITAIHVKEEGIDFDNCYYLAEEAHRNIYRRCNPEYHDVLMVNIGAGVGTTSIVDVDYEFSLKNVALLKPNNRVTSGTYLNFVLTHFKTQIISKLLSGGAQDFLSLSKISEIKIPLPPTPEEQHSIAEALSDVDALITELDALIEKKQQVKKGAMQQLLTGKKRLPGFDGEWEEYSLIDIADENTKWSFTGGPFGSDLKTEHYTEKGIRVIQLQNIGDGRFINENQVYTTEGKANELISNNIYPGEIILSKMGDPVARACIIPDIQDRYLMCSDGIRLKADNKRFDTKFIHAYLNYEDFRERAESASSGSTRKRIGLQNLKKLKVEAPSLEEQKAIAGILSDMDAEIQALQSKRSKYEKIKQGIMQELLTGKTRLV